MSKVFFGGSRKLPRLNSAIRTRLRNLITNGHTVLVGDANGADKAVQSFFCEEGYQNVIVYCMDGNCRNNVGNWDVKSIDSGGKRKDFKYFAMKDAEMSRDADHGFMLWDGKSKGTLNNALNLLQQSKSVLIYFSPKREFVPVKEASDLDKLLERCDPSSREELEKKIKVSKRNLSNQGSLNLA